MDIERRVSETIRKYNLLNKKDKVVVALSGGKDSTSVLYILKNLGYDVEGLMIDLGLGSWSEMHKKNMEKICFDLGIKFSVVELKKEIGQGICFIKAVLKKKKNLTGCTVCGVIKRWILNKEARRLGADKIVTGHNLDDECQTVLMNFLKGNIFLGVNSTPATGVDLVVNSFSDSKGAHPLSSRGVVQPTHSEESKYVSENTQGIDTERGYENSFGRIISARRDLSEAHKKFVQRVKPLFFVPENEIRKYAKRKKFAINFDRCPCAFGTYRVETRGWMEEMKDADKLKVVKSWQKIIPKLKKKNFEREINECEICGEPTVGKVCNACGILGEL